jgi:SAM-dependent methyltransferase
MKIPDPQSDWPQSWRTQHAFDITELCGDVKRSGRAYYYQQRRAVALRLIEEVVPKGSSVLDVAAGQGNFTLALAERDYRVTWNDLRGDLEGYVRLKHERGEVRFAPGNVLELGLEQSFDCVLIAEIIEHVAHPDEFLQKLSAMVRPGGYIVMTTPNGAYIRNRLPRFSDCPDPSMFESVQFRPDGDGHIFLLWPDEVVSLSERVGLALDDLHFFATPLTNGHRLSDVALRYTPTGLIDVVEHSVRALPGKVSRRLLMHTAARFKK